MSGWKTLLFNGVVGILVVIAQLAEYVSAVDLSAILPSNMTPWVIVAVGLVNILLRHVTKGSAGWIAKRDEA
ncbi:hypothetical protein [Roseibium polysiphoniae]|uniref:hypothetical protein n=1 Tax=Roseibium polysiphoniae TaxID=2571221 RepID=UPI0032988CD0